VAARAFLAAAPMAAPMAALTGRPGTGKTYLTAMIVNALLDAGVPVDVAAPTGKAASVLTLKLDRRVDVVTIHRLIGLAPGQIPGYHQHNQLSSRVVVVDESSMIDSELLGMLLDAIDPVRTFVLLVGDPNQLNPVGYGSPFADLVRNKLIPVAELTEIQRQAGDNGIIQMAHSFADGKLLLPEKNVYHFKMDPTRLKDEAINLYCSDRLKAKFGLESVQKEFLILSPVKQEKYNASTASINEAISHRLLPARDLGKSKFARGDRIIFTVNNYAHGFVNGELGVLEDYSRRGGHARIRNDIGTVYELDDYSLGQYADWAYALTVHKAQGSECRVVALLLEPGAKQMYTRNLVYTAITRAREELLIFGDLKTLEEAAARPDNRVCALPYLVRNPDLSARIIERTQPADLSSFAEDYK
jgi:exodeoxyribonuclease V alpha subunit